MKNFLKEVYNDKERIILGTVVFVSYIVLCKVASDIGDKYFPKERYMSEDFWNWKPK